MRKNKDAVSNSYNVKNTKRGVHMNLFVHNEKCILGLPMSYSICLTLILIPPLGIPFL
jgi:hypothetical protein